MHGWQNLWDYKLWVSWFRGRFFLTNDSKASIDNRSMDDRIYVIHLQAVGLAVSEKKIFKFSPF